MAGKLFHRICDIKFLWQAWIKVKGKGSAGGIDGVNINEFEKGIDKRLKELSQLLQQGRYIPEPTKRIHIPKGRDSKETRPIALPVVQDKIVQEAVRCIITPLFEPLFLDVNYARYIQGKGTYRPFLQKW